MDFSSYKTGDLISYQVHDNKTDKTLTKYGLFLYSYTRHSYYKKTKYRCLVLGRLHFMNSYDYVETGDNHKYSRMVIPAGLKFRKIFLYKNDTIKNIYNDIEAQELMMDKLSSDETALLSLGADMLKREFSNITYSHE